MGYPTVARLKQMQARAQDFLDEKHLVFHDEKGVSRAQKFAHFVLLVLRGFVQNRCPVRAGALSYTTILALIPLLAVGISVAGALLKQKGDEANTELFSKVIDTLVSKTAPQLGLVPKTDTGEPALGPAAPRALKPEAQDARAEVVRRINDFINNMRSGTIGVTGMVALVLVAISLLATIEATFNDIWGITRGRRWWSRVVRYWTAITLGPILVVVAITLSTGPHLRRAQLELALVMNILLAITPIAVMSITLALLYILIPNTKVQWRAAFVGGAVAGCLWQVNNLLSFLFISKVVTYQVIYKSFAAIPVFMFGLFLSWLIVLFGAQVAYVFQNRRAYVQEKMAEAVNQRGREFVALRVMTLIADRFYRGEQPATINEMSEKLAVTSRLISQVLATLRQGKIVDELKLPEGAFIPSRPLEAITADDILRVLRAGSGHEPVTREDNAREFVRTEFERIEQAERQVSRSVTLKDLAVQASRAPAA